MTATPTGRLLGQWPDGSDEWHAARASRLGGSDMAAVLGRSPWVSPYRLWHLKAGLVGDTPSTPEQQRGHYLEPAIAAWWADQHPEYEVVDAGTYVHADRDYQLANPDRLAVKNGTVELLELKSDAQDDTAWGKSGTDGIPLYYRTQLQWYMDTLGVQVAHVAVITARLEFRHYTVAYDPEDAAILRTRAELFLDSLMFGDPPPLDSHRSTYETVRDLHPAIDGTEVELTTSQARDYCEARHALKAAQEGEQAARTRLADRMGAAQRAVFCDMTIATRQAKAGGTPFVKAATGLPRFTPHADEENAA